ncbi:MAG: hypothetical protein HZB53_12645 [Chloroflexi bacterium]|nr:hypothetical protein [Chloroflexota bacterium]
MCSITANNTVEEQLSGLSTHDAEMIKRRLVQQAGDANLEHSGPIDRQIMTRMPPELKGLHKLTVGRHRVYVTGHHTHCTYHTVYVKAFKKSGVDNEDDRKFQGKLIAALTSPGGTPLALPPEE